MPAEKTGHLHVALPGVAQAQTEFLSRQGRLVGEDCDGEVSPNRRPAFSLERERRVGGGSGGRVRSAAGGGGESGVRLAGGGGVTGTEREKPSAN